MLTHAARAAGAAPRDADEAFFTALRASEFARLDAERLSYLDYTGAALPAESQMAALDALVRAGVLGNPHSMHAPSQRSTAYIERARARVLRFLGASADDYAVAFTANATGAARLVAEAFPFQRGSTLVLSADNHNSVNGIREYARRAGARLRTVPLDRDLRLAATDEALTPADAPSLFAFPAQSNFSGVRHPLSLVHAARARGYRVLLDAAAYVPSSPLDLRATPADFVTVSFYKMFGLPTGVGALIARHDAMALLRRPWFAGGTVDWVSVQHQAHHLRASIDAFEDGTPNYAGIAALEPGFDLLEGIGMLRLSARVRTLTRQLLAALADARHQNDAPVFRVYGPGAHDDRGGVVALNMVDADGRVVPYEHVELHAAARGVAVRGGCFCNPGAAEAALAFPPERTLDCLRTATAGGFTLRRFAECLGGDAAVGALRVSVGAATTPDDISRAVHVMAGLCEGAATR